MQKWDLSIRNVSEMLALAENPLSIMPLCYPTVPLMFEVGTTIEVLIKSALQLRP
jgi:hypothetical protein